MHVNRSPGSQETARKPIHLVADHTLDEPEGNGLRLSPSIPDLNVFVGPLVDQIVKANVDGWVDDPSVVRTDQWEIHPVLCQVVPEPVCKVVEGLVGFPARVAVAADGGDMKACCGGMGGGRDPGSCQDQG